MARRGFVAGALVLAAVVFPAPAAGMGNPDLAALQVALRAKGLFHGTIDGVAGPRTRRAIRRFQRRAGLAVDGIAGPRTRRALGRRGRPRIGRRALHSGHSGWDVAALQFMLAWHGFPSGPIDGGLGPRTGRALRRFQRWARLGADGIAGPATLARLRSPPARAPVGLAYPVQGPLGDRFGPRGNRFHTGVDFPVPSGRAVRAARAGRVTWAAWWPGGFGKLVSIAHGGGARTIYAHLSAVTVRRGERVGLGTRVGRVGATGYSTGPHLHFELRLRGAALDPLGALR